MQGQYSYLRGGGMVLLISLSVVLLRKDIPDIWGPIPLIGVEALFQCSSGVSMFGFGVDKAREESLRRMEGTLTGVKLCSGGWRGVNINGCWGVAGSCCWGVDCTGGCGVCNIVGGTLCSSCRSGTSPQLSRLELTKLTIGFTPWQWEKLSKCSISKTLSGWTKSPLLHNDSKEVQRNGFSRSAFFSTSTAKRTWFIYTNFYFLNDLNNLNCIYYKIKTRFCNICSSITGYTH